ncbi:MAG: dTDP-4-dehydrorhamnose 3,5-epimerase [Flavobacteriaceae bacterium]|nr:dTDP-4-dehydrorhamnose 3,5-epimerase [Flavobacteriaceae bacterium]|tara:strand:+ start:10532 stop:11059 length:528 start_codon:yes stop_codon:yes gene_type:complete
MYNDFKIDGSKIFGDQVKIISPDLFKDKRGFLYTDYLESFFSSEFNLGCKFIHSKYAYNNKKVLRGIHGDCDSYKLINCVYGEIFQVVVDCRKNSSTYLRHETFQLNHNNPKLILIPPGFGNAFQVISDYSIYSYKLAYLGEYNDYDKQFTFKWNDKRIGINWPINDPILSSRDK